MSNSRGIGFSTRTGLCCSVSNYTLKKKDDRVETYDLSILVSISIAVGILDDIDR